MVKEAHLGSGAILQIITKQSSQPRISETKQLSKNN